MYKSLVKYSFIILMIIVSGHNVYAEENKQNSLNISDEKISDIINEKFYFDSIVNYNSVDVETDNRIVTLTGSTSNILAKERASRISEAIKGVDSVINLITVRPSEEIKDTEISKNIHETFLENPALKEIKIDSSVMNGIVTLSGDVQSQQEKILAEKIAKQVKGVLQVNNLIDINPAIAREDNEIKEDILEAMKWDPLLNQDFIDVTVKGGEVTLDGAVGSVAEKDLARNLAFVRGVKSVEVDKLTVNNWLEEEYVRKSPYKPKTDLEIREHLQDKLVLNPLVDSFEIMTDIDDGVVTLKGDVNNLKAKNTAERIAENTLGV